MNRQLAKAYLLAVVLAVCAFSSSAQTVNGLSTNNVIVNFASFNAPSNTVSSVTVQGCYSFTYGGVYYYNAPVTLGKYNYPAITNGYAVFTNLLCGVPYTLTLSGYATYTTNFNIPYTVQPDGNSNISAFTWVGQYVPARSTFTWANPAITNYLIGVGATNVVPTNGTTVIIGQTLYLNTNYDAGGSAAAVQSGVVSGSIVAAIAVKATNAPDGNVSASLNQSTNIALVAAQKATNGLPASIWTLGTASAQNTNVFLGTNFAVTTLNGLTNNFSVDSTGKGTLTIGNTNSSCNVATNAPDGNVSASLNQSTNIALVAAQNATNGLPSRVWTLGTASAQNTNVFLGTNFTVTTLNGLTNNFSVDSTGKGTLTIGNTNSSSNVVTNGSANNTLQTNMTLAGKDNQTLNQNALIGSVHSTEQIVVENQNLKPYIAFASCLNKLNNGKLTILELGDSLAGVNYYNSVPKTVIELLCNSYGWVGDYCWQPDQLGGTLDTGRTTSTNYWFGVGAGEIDAGDNAGNNSYSQGAYQFLASTKIWPNANQASVMYIQQPLGGSVSFFDRLYRDGRRIDYGGINDSITSPTYTISTSNNLPNLMVTNVALAPNYYWNPAYYEPSRHSILFNYAGVTGTNVIIGGGFENTLATNGVRTYWLGDNSAAVMPDDGGSLSPRDWAAPARWTNSSGVNLLHQFANIAKPDVIIYMAADYYAPGATNFSDLTNSLATYLGNNGLATTNTKVFVISRPDPGGAYPPTTSTTTNSLNINNQALRVACEANGWSYISLQESYSSGLYGNYPSQGLGVDPYNQPVGIIKDGVHPSDWGSFVMALDVLNQLHVPLKFDPTFDNPNMSYQYIAKPWYVFTPSSQVAGGVDYSVANTVKVAASPDVLPFVLAGGTTNINEVRALNLFCSRLRQNNLFPDGSSHRLGFWPMLGAGGERTARFNLMNPSVNYLGICNTVANNSTSNDPASYWSYTAQGVRLNQQFSPDNFVTGLRPAVRDAVALIPNGPGGTGDSINYNIINSTNSGFFMGIYRTTTNVPTSEGYWMAGYNYFEDTIYYTSGSMTTWFRDGNANFGSLGTYYPFTGVVGRNIWTNQECFWLNNTNFYTYNGSSFSDLTHEITFAQSTQNGGACISTNAIIWALGVCSGYTQNEYTNLTAIVAQFGIDKTNANLNANACFNGVNNNLIPPGTYRSYSTNATLAAATTLVINFTPFADSTTNYSVTSPNDLVGATVTARTSSNFTLTFTAATLTAQTIEGAVIHK